MHTGANQRSAAQRGARQRWLVRLDCVVGERDAADACGSALPPLFCCCSGKNSVPTAADGFGLADTGQYVSCCGGPRLFAEARRAHAASYANDLGPQSQLATAEAALLHAPSVKMRPIPYGKVWTAKAVASAMCCSMKLAAPPSAITSHVLLGQSVTDLRRALCSSPEAPQSPSSFLA